MVDQYMSVSQVAAKLGVSPRRVRQLIEQGDLLGRRLGHSWVVPASELQLRERRRPSAGRPYSQPNIWRLAAHLDALIIPDPAPSAGDWLEIFSDGPALRWRPMVRKLVDPILGEEERLGSLRHRSNGRANHFVHPSLKRRLLDDARVSVSGAHAAEAYGLDLLAGDVAEVYIRDQEAMSVVDEHALQEAEPWEANVVLRPVGSFPHEPPRIVPRLILAADLMEGQDPRAQRAGAQLLDALLVSASSERGSS